MEAPETLVVTRIPSVVTSVVPVCVVSRCVFTSVVKCVLQRAHSVGARACVRATACVTETPYVEGVVASVPKCVPSSTPCMKETPCVEEAQRVSVTACVSSMVCVGETEGAWKGPGGVRGRGPGRQPAT